MLVLLREGPVELSITPDERNLADLRVGQSAVASAEAFPDRPFDARVSYLAPAVDPLNVAPSKCAWRCLLRPTFSAPR
jgi:HlyD family secretion protein